MLEEPNVRRAWRQVSENEGCAGADGVRIESLAAPGKFWKAWRKIENQLLRGSFDPGMLLRINIPKPNGDVRTLSIPSVMDRVVLQAAAQVIAPAWEPTFSPYSFAYRPGRGAHDAIRHAHGALGGGDRWVVDLDIEEYFDNIDHTLLMEMLGERCGGADSPLVQLVRRFLKAPHFSRKSGRRPAAIAGIPQGSPLSPLLANIFLDPFDRFLSSNGCSFARYADDLVVLTISESRGKEILDESARFLSGHLRLRLNRTKSKVVPPDGAKFLGFTFRTGRNGRVRRAVHPDSLKRFREKVMGITAWNQGAEFPEMMAKLQKYVAGWFVYYRFAQQAGVLNAQRNFARERARKFLWDSWGTPERRIEELLKRGVRQEDVERLTKSNADTDRKDCQTQFDVLRKAIPDKWLDHFKPKKHPQPTSTKRTNSVPSKPLEPNPASRQAPEGRELKSWLFQFHLKLGKLCDFHVVLGR